MSRKVPQLVMPADGPIVVFDLEYTSWQGSIQNQWSRPGEHREIVAIGAVKLASTAGLPETDHLSCLVKPRINPELSGYFIALTGLTQERLDREGVPFTEALRDFAAFVGDDVAAVFSNGGDDEVMRENCRLEGLEFPFPALLFRNVRRAFVAATGLRDEDVDSFRLPELFGFQQEHHAHDALDDARAVAAALRTIGNSILVFSRVCGKTHRQSS